MSDKKIFQIIGMIDDDLITEAADSAKKVRHIKISKIALIAAAMTILFGMTVFAASCLIANRSVHSSSIPDYFNVPSQQTLEKDIGIAPRINENFANGYTFETGGIARNEDFDEDGNVCESYKSFHCRYSHGEDEISLYIDGSSTGNQMDDCETVKIHKNSEIKYSAYTNKIVPGNYQLTEQDERDKAEGKYVFSYGSEEIEIRSVQVMAWEYKGLNYNFCAIDSSITKDELADMAAELIDYQD